MKYLLSLCLSLSLACFAFTYNTERTITGKVTDEKGQPIAGASISIKGTKIGTTTNANGEFTITVSDEDAVLIIDYIGYETTEIKVKLNSNINILLKPKVEHLDEVVVTGYSIQKKKELTASVSSLITQSIQGSAAGIYIRGSRSINGNNKSTQYEAQNDEDKAEDIDDSWRYNNLQHRRL